MSFTGAWGSPAPMLVQVAPPSAVRNTFAALFPDRKPENVAYATCASAGSMAIRVTQALGRFEAVTWVQFAPRSIVNHTRPSSVPTNSSFGLLADTAIAVRVPQGYCVSGPGPPVRSGLITVHACAPFVDRFSRFPP